MMNVCHGNDPHKFEPRYDEIFPPSITKFESSSTNLPLAMRNKIYVCDVCIRCGAISKLGATS